MSTKQVLFDDSKWGQLKTQIEQAEIRQWEEPKRLPDLSPVKEFDYALLPDSLRDWVQDTAELLNCPPDFVAVTVLASLSSLIGARAALQPKKNSDWYIYCNLWAMLVGNPSTGKSPSIKEGTKPLNSLMTLELEKYQQNQESHKTDLAMYEILKKDSEQKAKKAIEEGKHENARFILENIIEPKKPILRRFFINDTTVEKLGEILVENPWGTLILRDELFGLFTSMEKQGQEGSRAFYLQGFDGNQSFTFDRIGRGTVHIPRVFISMLGGIQPGRLQDYIRQAINGGASDDGLLQRFNMAVYPDPIRTFKNVDRYPNLIARDKAKEVFVRFSKIDPIDDEPRIWRFNPIAQRVWDEWYICIQEELIQGELHPAIESHLGKYPKLVGALALIFANIESNDGVVDQVSILRATAWAEFLRSHAERIYQSATMPEVNNAKSILKKIKSGTLTDDDGKKIGFTSRDITQKQWAGLSDPVAVKTALNLLIDYGYLQSETVLATARGGRPTEKFFINKYFLEAQK
jgi:putative DNA primase/helicase